MKVTNHIIQLLLEDAGVIMSEYEVQKFIENNQINVETVSYEHIEKLAQNYKTTKTYTAEEFFNQGSGIVTLCGSTRFFFEAMEANRILTFKNWMVLMCGSWGHSLHKFDLVRHERDYSMIKKLHFQKILESQAVVVVSDSSGYTGESTQAEIAFAMYRKIPVFDFDGEFGGMTHKDPPQLLDDTSLIDEFAREHGGLGF